MLEAIRVGSVDFGGVGDTPPIFAQAAHADLLYVAAHARRRLRAAAAPGSKLQTLHDLKGKKLAFARGSSAHNLRWSRSEKAGLAWTDIVPVPLAPPTPRRRSNAAHRCLVNLGSVLRDV